MHDSRLVQRLTDVSKQLERVASTRRTLDHLMNPEAKISVQDEEHWHRGLAKRWNTLLLSARSTPGFESFLQPSPCSTLLHHLPESGAVVILNVHGDRCDGVVLSATLKDPLHIPLPNFSLEKAKKYRQDLDAQLQSRGIRMRDAEAGAGGELSERALKRYKKPVVGMHEVLRGLWIEVAKPILDALKYSVSAAFMILQHCPILTIATEVRPFVFRCRTTKNLVVPNRRNVFPPHPCRWTVRQWKIRKHSRLRSLFVYTNHHCPHRPS